GDADTDVGKNVNSRACADLEVVLPGDRKRNIWDVAAALADLFVHPAFHIEAGCEIAEFGAHRDRVGMTSIADRITGLDDTEKSSRPDVLKSDPVVPRSCVVANVGKRVRVVIGERCLNGRGSRDRDPSVAEQPRLALPGPPFEHNGSILEG